MRHRALVFLAALAVASSIAADKPRFANSESISAARLRAHLEFIASDELEGRGTPSRGLDTAARYLATQLKIWGVKPAGDDGTYFQRIPLKRPSVNLENSTLSIAGQTLKYSDQYYAGIEPGSIEGPLVYVGDGYHRPGQSNDPYAKVQVKGKVLLAVQGRPADIRWQDLREQKAFSPHDAATKFGAVGILFISAEQLEEWKEDAERTVQPGWTRPVIPGEVETAMPTAVVRVEALAEALKGEPVSAEELAARMEKKELGEPFELQAGKLARLSVVVNDNLTHTQNVVAVVEGSDPVLKNEYVAVGAHYDHVGMRTSGTGDRIFNGADDDGSGTVSILEIAHALAVGPRPKRSVLFVWHAGEEMGLWGSRYFVEKPTVPINNIVAQLNIDMIGRSKKAGDTNARNADLTAADAVYLVGQSRISTELGQLAMNVNSRFHKLVYDPKHDAHNHPDRIFFRSDHYSYAKKGIPVLFWFSGVHEDYHRVSDHVDKIDFVKLEKVAQTVYATAFELANRKSRPKIDKPLSPSER